MLARSITLALLSVPCLVAGAGAAPITIEFSGRTLFVSAGSGFDSSVGNGTAFQGRIVVDLDAPVPDRPDDPQFPLVGLHYVQVDDFLFTVGNYTIRGGGLSTLNVHDEDPTFSGDLVRLGLTGLASSPGFIPGSSLSMLFDFGDETHDFVTSTDFLFPTDLSDWTGGGLTFTEFASGVGFVPKFLATTETWQVTPEPASAALVTVGLLSLASLRRPGAH
jgi:hypothetical protein